MATQPIINGFAYDFADVEVTMNGTVVADITSISYSYGHQSQKHFGTGREARARTKGQADGEASITMELEAYYAFIRRLGNGYREAIFNITVTYGNNGERLITDQIIGCNMQQTSRQLGAGGEGLMVEVPLSIAKILEDGIEPYNNAAQVVPAEA